MYKFNILIWSILLVFGQISLSNSDTTRKTPGYLPSETAGPYYNPATKSYFELVSGQQGARTWRAANKRAQEYYFKDTQGRLAIVPNLATHQFITRHFKGNFIWIGLRYICNSTKLEWVDGSKVDDSSFSAWTQQWVKDPTVQCNNQYIEYMPIFYTNATPTQALMWQATGPEKGFNLFLVEYPTGKK